MGQSFPTPRQVSQRPQRQLPLLIILTQNAIVEHFQEGGIPGRMLFFRVLGGPDRDWEQVGIAFELEEAANQGFVVFHGQVWGDPDGFYA